MIIQPSANQFSIAAAVLAKNGLVDEQTGKLTEKGRIALEYSFLGTPERVALLAEAVLETRKSGLSNLDYLRGVVNLVCFEHAIGFQSANCKIEDVCDSASDIVTALRICEKLKNLDLVKETAWIGC